MNQTNPNFEVDDLTITPHVVLENLPALLKDFLTLAPSTEQKDMLLLSTLTSVSSVLNNLYFHYAHTGKRYYPNLMTFIMAGAAGGKGIADLSRQLVEPIHEQTSLIIAGDSTYPAFYQQLAMQHGSGLLFETEGSVITDIWRSSAMSYNTALRKAAEHETLSKNRVRAGQSEIVCPKLGMLLTGTFSQFRTLVPNVENGFFSRLTMLVVRERQQFDATVFQPSLQNQTVASVVRTWSQRLLRLYECLQNHELEFRLTDEQASQLGRIMADEYRSYVQQLGDAFHASVIRNGVNVMRIAAVLSALRWMENNLSDKAVSSIPETLLCTPADFETALLLGTKLLLHAADAYTQIDGANQQPIPQMQGSYQKSVFLATLPFQFTTGECISFGTKMGVNARTVKRWLLKWVEDGVITKTAYGHYQKLV